MKRKVLPETAFGWLLFLAVLGILSGAILTFAQEKPFDIGFPGGQGTVGEPGQELKPVQHEAPSYLADEENTVQVYEATRRGVIMVLTDYPDQGRRGNGSGFFWDQEGHVVTNFHVVEDARSILVHTSSGNSYEAKVIGTDRLTDLAVLKVEAPKDEIFPLPRGDFDKVKVGQKAIVMGSPFASDSSLGLDRSPGITTGIISAKDRSLPIPSRTKPGVNDFTVENLLQTDAAVNPGNSGGPLLDSHGKVVGIVTAIIDSANGIGFAIPVNVAEAIVPQLIRDGRVQRAYLGVSYLPLDDLKKTIGDAYEMLGFPPQGALVTDVDKGGPADKAGLKGGTRRASVRGQEILLGGDVIVALEGVPIFGSNLSSEILKYPPGTIVTVEVLRDAKRLAFKVVLGSR